MSGILVVGSVAFDSVRTPFGERERVLGGSATYFSVAASYFAPVAVVAVVGEDFGAGDRAVLAERGIDLSGLVAAPGETFHWKGEYGEALNEAHTLDTRLGVFAAFRPTLSESHRDAPVVFLANIDPEVQASVLDQVRSPSLVAADTMNFWIEGKPEALRRLLARVHVVLLNDGEARLLSGETNLRRAARAIRAMGPETVVIKLGAYGVFVTAGDEEPFVLPAFPLEDVADPTGAGDTFAGGFMGYLAARGARDQEALRRAAASGSTLASFNVESFSLDRIRALTPDEIGDRYRRFMALTRFGELDVVPRDPRGA